MEPYEYQCEVCKSWVDERTMTIWNKLVGWEKKRDQGGTNHVALRRPLPEFRCDTCMKKALNGDVPGQEVMFV